MAAVTICSDLGAPKNKVWHFPMKWWDQMPWSSFSECWALSQLFHSPLSLSSRGFWVPLHFLHKGGVICISEIVDISPSNLDSTSCFFQPSISHDVLSYKLNKEGDNIQPWRTPFPIWNQSVVSRPVLTVVPGLHTGLSEEELKSLDESERREWKS